MSEKRLLNALHEIGLGELEAKVYHAALAGGAQSVSSLARASGVKRTSVYYVLESLIARQLIHEEYRGFKKVYTPAHPEKLDAILEEKRRSFQNLLPDFAALYNLKGGESSIKFYDGLDAMKEVYDRLIAEVRPNEDYLVISDMTKWYQLDPSYFQGFMERRAEMARSKNVRIRLLLQDSEITREVKKRQVNYAQEVRILPEGTPLTTNLVVIPSLLVIHQTVPPIFAMVFQNPNIIRLHQELFEIIWQTTPA